MNADQIIDELPTLKPDELQRINSKLRELMIGNSPAHEETRSWGEALEELAGTVKDLPPDYSENHDHYLHGAPRR